MTVLSAIETVVDGAGVGVAVADVEVAVEEVVVIARTHSDEGQKPVEQVKAHIEITLPVEPSIPVPE